MENNFKCLTCGEEFFIPRFSFQITKGGNIYIDKSTKKEVECSHCHSTFIESIQRKLELDSIMYGKFSSASDEEKKRILRNRADKHKKKTKDQYKTIDREFHGRVNTKHY